MSTPTAPRHVALLGHRLASAHATGIGRYYKELGIGLAAIADPSTHRYTLASTRERTNPTWVPAEVARRTVRGPRKLLPVTWALVRRPRVDRSLGRPDLLHLLHPWAAPPSRAPLVTTLHDLMPLHHPDWYGRLERWSFVHGVHQARDQATLIVANSQHTADLAVAELGIDPWRLRVVWMGVGDEFRARPTTEDLASACRRHGVEVGRFLIAIGAVSDRKNLTVVMRALSRVDPALLGSPALLVAGPPGVGAARLEAEIAELGLGPRVRFAGYVDDADLPVLLGASLALVHPSRYEGFGMTPLEAMAAGVPALVSDAGSLPEVTGSAALVMGPDDVDGWAAAITTVASDPDGRAALVRAGDQWQSRFRWSRTATETMAVHDEVLGSG